MLTEMPAYPFSAIVGQERMKRALLVNAVNPAIGGVLIRGERGAAKSTAARALATLLPEIAVVAGCPYACDPAQPFAGCPHCTGGEIVAMPRRARLVDLPIGATEDRVLGTLHLEHALRTGERRFEPGLLAAAHRGVLYIDEVNLLPDHLVDILLDAAATGRNVVEREGISFTHPARFLLIGTMNPEEGALRPQFLDRFGLVVDAEPLPEPSDRAEVVRRRVAYEADPTAFATRWAEDECDLRDQIATAQTILPHVSLADDLLDLIARICINARADGMRADLAIYRTACVLAALANRSMVEQDDIYAAAILSLPHRQRQPMEMPPSSGSRNSSLPDHDQGDTQQPEPPDTSGNANDHANAPTTLFDAAPALPVALPPDRATDRPTNGMGRHGAPTPYGPNGPARGGPAAKADGSFALVATVRAAAPHQHERRAAEHNGLAVQVSPEDVRVRRREPPAGHVVLFVVDASGSMAAERRMAVAKGAALSMLAHAYQRRDHVGLIAFRGAGAELVLPPTRSVEHAERRLHDLPTGGRTPLAHALHLAREVLARPAHAGRLPVIVVLSDGRANVALAGGAPLEEAYAEAHALRDMRVRALVLDSETGPVRLGLAERLAAALGADYRPLDDLDPAVAEQAVRAALPALFTGTESAVPHAG